MGWTLISSRHVQVNEGDYDVDTGMHINAGDNLYFYAWGVIWAGVWFTGVNGPRGWNYRDSDPKFPLPGAHPFMLLGHLQNGYFEIGSQAFRQQTPDGGELYLRINDDTPGNGTGAFQCDVQLYRDV